MDISVTGPRKLIEFTLFGLNITITDTVVSSVVVMLLLVGLSWFLGEISKNVPAGGR